MQDSLALDLLPSESGEGFGSVPRKAHVRQGQVFRHGTLESLLPTDVSSLVPEEDAARWIRLGLEQVDLGFVKSAYADCGGIPYDPRAMLGILLYAYFEGDTGSRTIEKRCRRDVGYMLVGYGLKPDDRTLRRFRRRVGPHLDELFGRVVRICKEEGLLPMRRVAVDGTKMASSASQLKRWLKSSENEDMGEMGLEPEVCSDPDARSVGASGKFLRGYNCQAAVDCDSGIVVAADVSNVNSDGQWLAPMVEQTVENAQARPVQVVADAGYDTYEGAAACAERGIEAILAPHDAAGTFWTVTKEDKIVCPMGQEARPSGKPLPISGKRYQTLRVATCRACPLAAECSGPSRTRTLSHPVGTDPIHRLNAAYRSRSPEGKAAMQERMATIEPVFADVKWNKGLGRFRLSRLTGARLEWTLIHLARNLAKLGKSLTQSLTYLFYTLGMLFERHKAPVCRPRQSFQP
jgi:transposase